MELRFAYRATAALRPLDADQGMIRVLLTPRQVRNGLYDRSTTGSQQVDQFYGKI